MLRGAARLRAPLIALTLGSCSYAYDLKVIAIGGHLAFVVDPSSYRQPDCIRSIFVEADDGEPSAVPADGDDRGLVENGSVYWWDFRDVRSCDNPFPIIYGKELKGTPSEGIGFVAAKPLLVDVVYHVGAESSGSGYGSAWFKIRRDGEIENYRSDPTPPLRDANGYVVGDEAK